MKTPGFLKDALSHPMTLVIATVLCTASLTSLMVKNTSEENISGKNENLELVLVMHGGEELQLKVTGKNTTEVVQSLKKILQNMDILPSNEKSYLYIPR